MMYDFTTLLPRPDSMKWNLMQNALGGAPEGLVPLTVADMEWKNAPEIVDGLKEYLDRTILGYPLMTQDYRQAVVSWMKRRHDFDVQPEAIVPVAGIVPALFHAVSFYTEPGDGVIVMPPVYYPFFWSIQEQGREVVECPLLYEEGRYRMDLTLLERLAADPANRLLLFCSPHNPVSRVWTAEELDGLLQIARAHKLLIVSDEIHHDLVMPGFRHTVLETLADDAARYTITCTAPSKTFNLAGMSTSNLIIHDEERRHTYETRARSAGLSKVTLLGYKACELAYNRAGDWLDQAILRIRDNDRLLEAFLAAHFPEIRPVGLEGTYLKWLDLHAFPHPDDDLVRHFQEKAGFYVQDGALFGKGGSGFARLNLALPATVLEAQLQSLAAAYGRA